MKNNTDMEKWHSFSEILHRLHAEGIYINYEQLAEFFLAHGLPVDLRYVPERLTQRANIINKNYQGDLANLSENPNDSYCDFSEFW